MPRRLRILLASRSPPAWCLAGKKRLVVSGDADGVGALVSGKVGDGIEVDADPAGYAFGGRVQIFQQGFVDVDFGRVNAGQLVYVADFAGLGRCPFQNAVMDFFVAASFCGRRSSPISMIGAWEPSYKSITIKMRFLSARWSASSMMSGRPDSISSSQTWSVRSLRLLAGGRPMSLAMACRNALRVQVLLHCTKYARCRLAA